MDVPALLPGVECVAKELRDNGGGGVMSGRSGGRVEAADI